MKKLLMIAAILGLTVSFVGCGPSTATTSKKAETPTSKAGE